MAFFVVIKLRVIFGNLHLKLYLQPPLGGEADRHVADGGVLPLALGGYTHCRGVSWHHLTHLNLRLSQGDCIEDHRANCPYPWHHYVTSNLGLGLVTKSYYIHWWKSPCNAGPVTEVSMVNTEWWRHRGPRAWTGAECGESGEYTSGDDRFLGGQPAPAPPLPRSSCTLQPSPPAQLTRMCHLQMCQEGDFKNIFFAKICWF